MHFRHARLAKRAGFLASSCMFVAVLGNAQDVSDANPDQTIRINVSKTDQLAATGASGSSKHIFPPRNPDMECAMRARNE